MRKKGETLAIKAPEYQSARIVSTSTEMSGKKRNIEYNFEYAVGLNQWSMRLLGLWPLDERFSGLKWSIGFSVALVFLFPSMALMVKLTSWDSIIEQAVTTVPLALLLMKLLFIRSKSANFRIILRAMMDDWTKFSGLPNWGKRIMIRHARIGRRVNIICITCMAVSLLGYMTMPSATKKMNEVPKNPTTRKLPTQGLYPFDSADSPTYEILYVSQAIVSCLYCIVTFSLDCFLSVIVFHACGQLSALAKTLQYYNKRNKHVETKEPSVCVCACLRCIVRRHVSVTMYMDIVERSFNVFVLLQLAGNFFILAAEGYQLIVYAEDSDALGFLTFAVYTVTVTYNIFIYCYIGECIIRKSEEIGSTVYNLAWDDLPRNLAQPLILLMIRSRKPCKITAGGFVTISLSYYQRILTKAISYISVLRAIR